MNIRRKTVLWDTLLFAVVCLGMPMLVSCGVTKTEIVEYRVTLSEQTLRAVFFRSLDEYRKRHNGRYPEGDSSGKVFLALVREFNLPLETLVNPLRQIGDPTIKDDTIFNCGYEFNLRLAGKSRNHIAVPLVLSPVDVDGKIPGLILFTDGTIRTYRSEKAYLKAASSQSAATR